MKSILGPIDVASAALFRTLSRLRGKRAFHPHGAAFRIEVTPMRGGEKAAEPLFDGVESRSGTIRLSRGAGLPDPLPDVLGVAVRLDPTGDLPRQDLLLASSGTGPILHNLLIPSTSFGKRPFSSVLFYRSPGGVVLFGAKVRGRDSSLRLSEISTRERLDMNIDLVIASPFGRWVPVASIAVGERALDRTGEHLRFDPANTAADLVPIGFLNRIRKPVYVASQEGRGALQERDTVSL